MSDVVFILGAGASFSAGGPLMPSFLDTAKDLLLSGKVEDSKSAFNNVFRIVGLLQKVHSKAALDLYNIESIFTALEMAKVLKGIPGVADPSEVEDAIRDLKLLIVRTLEETVVFNVDRQHNRRAHDSYNNFIDLVVRIRRSHPVRRSVSVITFNYDMALDYAVQTAGMEPDYAIDAESSREGPGFLPIFKLHGSLNWAFQAGDRTISVASLGEYIAWNRVVEPPGINFFRIGSKLSEFFLSKRQINVEPTPVIVPPSWNKADYHYSLANVWSTAARHISAAKYVYIIGFSLPETDAFFRNFFALSAIGPDPLNKIAVVNKAPKGGSVDLRFQSLLGTGAASRYEYISTTFEESFGIIKKQLGVPM